MINNAEFLKGFQHTAARRRLANSLALLFKWCMFQHTAARRRLASTQRRSEMTR